MSIVYTIIILCILIVSHEFGHFIVAKINGIYVEEFSLGMGPKLVQWGKKETKYSIRLLPIGGYVKMEGEDEDSDNPRAFCNKGVLARMSVVFAGPFMNFVFAIIFFMVAFMYFGVPNTDAVIGEVAAGGPAYEAGLQDGDVVLSIDGNEVSTWEDMTSYTQPADGETLALQVERNGQVFDAEITPEYSEEYGYALIGITQHVDKANIFQSIKMGFVETYEFTALLIQSLYQMITGQMAVDVAGPVGMVSIVGQYADTAFMTLFMLAGILSINLGIINLLPFPALDGSRLVFLAIEGIRKKPVPADKEAMVHFVGIVFLMLLMVVITVNDIGRLMG
ncbi:MAG: RIP metalloprotease RseP [Bacillota bacterium]|jgi:regulator of sigma E protease